MIIESIIREHNFCGIVASTSEHVYNAWMRGNKLHFYVLSNEEKKPWPKLRDVTNYFIAHIENGEIHLVIDDVVFTLYSHDELINTIKHAFFHDRHNVITILETLLYVE